MSATHDRRRPTGLRAAAWVALASLSCTTVRVPASSMSPTVKVQGDVAEPQIELWVESAKNVSPEEAAEAAADARAALEQALAARQLGEGEQLLVVRAQGVSRTGSRKSDQKAAIAGLVVVGVAIVAVAVVAIVASKGKAVPAARSAPAAVPRPSPGGAAPVPVAVPRPAPPPVRVPVPAPAVRPVGVAGHPHVAVGVGVDVTVPVVPEGPPPAVWSESVVVGPPSAPIPGPTPTPDEAVAVLALRPPPPMNVSGRGFFARDLTRLELTLVDRATGKALWVKTVERDIDPRNPEAVRQLLDGALDQPGGWIAADAPM